ncbi:MAG: response regulator [Flavobacterium sp.]|nr:response regulator [Flavobacterium sp.]
MMKFNNVYVIDDDKIFHFIVQKLFNRNQIEVELSFFQNGHEAIEDIKEKLDCDDPLPDLILLDINMPILDGWQFLEEYQQLKEKFESEPEIYLISSSDNILDTAKAKEFDDVIKKYLLKPIRRADIEAIFTN